MKEYTNAFLTVVFGGVLYIILLTPSKWRRVVLSERGANQERSLVGEQIFPGGNMSIYGNKASQVAPVANVKISELC